MKFWSNSQKRGHMVTDITFKFGKAPTSPPETTKVVPITVFVGPNNSGKTKVLDEIRRYCSDERSPTQNLILEHLSFDVPLMTKSLGQLLGSRFPLDRTN